MQQDDIAIVGLPQHAVDNLFCGDGLAAAQAPVVRIDALAHDQIAHVLNDGKLRHLLGILRLMSDTVRGTKQNSLYANLPFDHPTPPVQLPPTLPPSDPASSP